MRPRPDEEAADRWLRARRIDLYWKAPGDRTAVALAAEEGNLRMLHWMINMGRNERLVSHLRLDNASGPLRSAIRGGHLDVCKYLVSWGAGAAIHRYDATDWETHIALAASCGHLHVCKWLRRIGAKEHLLQASRKVDSPFLLAVWGGHLSVCRWIVDDCGETGELRRSNSVGQHPMLIACKGGRQDVIEWLCESGVADDISKEDNCGNTPLTDAVRKAQVGVCKWLIAQGALEAEGVGRDERVRAIRKISNHTKTARSLVLWARRVLAQSDRFRRVVLGASVLTPIAQQHLAPAQRCRLPSVPRAAFMNVAQFLGVEFGPRLRRIRNFEEWASMASHTKPVAETKATPPGVRA